MFGSKKPTEFDEAQDKQLQQLMANQKVLIKNNAFFIEQRLPFTRTKVKM